MKLARFSRKPHYNRWEIIEGRETIDFSVVERYASNASLSADDIASRILTRQELQMQELMHLLRSGELTTQSALLADHNSDELTDWRHPHSDDRTDWLPPIEAVSFRDFYAFERHVVNARKRRGLEMVPEWYEAPAFYFSNIASIVGHLAPIRKPAATNELDYELEIAVVIGQDGSDISVEEADRYIAGLTILNDWSARDIQRREMKVGLGPAKGKDFATSVGPYLVTPDELEDRVLPDRSRGKRYDLAMRAYVNGQQYSEGNAKEMNWTFAQLIAHASRDTILKAGDLIGSGTAGTGCITEFPEGAYPWLQVGDVVRLEIDGLGALETRIV